MGQHGRMEKYLELAIYRTVQELMTNVAKHAHANECYVKVIIAADQIAITVTDDGIGIPPAKAQKKGIGLASIHSKIKLLNGKIMIDSDRDKGTTVRISIPQPEQL